jgi:ABC-2 type transport system permease protein
MFRDKSQLIWLFGYPLIFIVIFSLAFGSTGSRAKYDVIVFNNDIIDLEDPEDPLKGNASLIFLDIIEDELDDFINIIGNEDNYTKDEAQEELKYERVDCIIVIEENFTEDFMSNEAPTVNISTIPDEVVEGIMYSIVNQIVNTMIIQKQGAIPADIKTTTIQNTVKLTPYDYLAPGFVIAGVLVCISQFASHIAEEKQTGTLKRLITTPVARRDILLSGMFSQLVVAAVQTVILLILLSFFGAYFHPNTNYFLLVLIPLLFAFTSLGFGLILASIVKTEASAGGLAWFIILPLQFLGGIFFIYNNPIQSFIPTSYAAHAMRVVMISGQVSWDAIGIDLLVLLGFGLGSTMLGILLFQRKTAVL